MANEPAELIFFDSCVFFDATNEGSSQFRLLRPLMERAERGEVRILISTILLPEALFIDRDNTDTEAERKRVNAHLKSHYYRFISVEDFIGMKAQEIRVHHRLSTADAVHVASAIYSEAPVLLTNDGDAKKQCEKKPKSRSILLMHEKYHVGDDDTRPMLKVITPCDYLIMKNAEAIQKRERERIELSDAEERKRLQEKAQRRQDFRERSKHGLFENFTDDDIDRLAGDQDAAAAEGEAHAEEE